MKITDYVPKLYENNIEMQNIMNSEELEFEKHIKADVENAFDDNFIKNATLKGIEQYEEILHIKPNNSLSLEERRQQVILRLLASVPYTYRKLCEILDGLFGQGGYFIEKDFDNYTMIINTDSVNIYIAELTNQLLKKIIPANIDWSIHLIQSNENQQYMASYLTVGDYETLKVESED